MAALILSRPGDAYLLAGIIFALASFTDLLDGKLARRTQKTSPLGIFLDTTADKVMVGLTLAGLAIARLSPAWIPLVIIGREFVISGLRSFAASCNRIISAHAWGKGKAAVTMVAIVATLVAASGRVGGVLSHGISRHSWAHAYDVSVWLLGLSALLTVVSGIRYLVDAWPLFREEAIQVTGERAEEQPRKLVRVE